MHGAHYMHRFSARNSFVHAHARKHAYSDHASNAHACMDTCASACMHGHAYSDHASDAYACMVTHAWTRVQAHACNYYVR